jgi:hypothetical protein
MKSSGVFAKAAGDSMQIDPGKSRFLLLPE